MKKTGERWGGPGSVSFNFEPKGLLLIKKEKVVDEQILKLIDLGAEDVIEEEGAIEVYVSPHNLSQIQKKVTDNGFTVSASELIQKPKNFQDVSGSEIEKVTSFLDKIESHDDVQKVFTNANFV